MMKQAVLKQAVLLLAALAAAPAFAQNWYVTGSAGRGQQEVSFEGESSKENKTGVSAGVGYRFSPTFSVEAGYATVGKVSDRDSFGSATIKSDAYYGVLVGNFPVWNKVSVIGKLGLARNRSAMRIETAEFTASVDENRTGAMFGAGAAFAVTPSLAIVAEYQYFGKSMDYEGFKVKASMVSAGVRFTF